MSAGLKAIVVKFAADTTDLTHGAEKAGHDLGGFAKSAEHSGSLFSKAFKFDVWAEAAKTAIEGVKKVGESLYGMVEKAQEAEKASALTAAVIKSTGGAAGVTAGDVDKLATSLSNMAGVSEEVIHGGENLLLTFPNVRNEAGKNNDIFNQASTAALNMSAAMNHGTVTQDSLKASTIQLGKALSDPVKGLGALARVGVVFTQAQKDQIKTMVKAGDTMGAQKIILGELNREFGGAAAASTSPAQKASVAWENLQRQIGTYFLPIVTKVFDFLSKTAIPALSRFADWADKHVVPALKRLGDWIVQNVVPAVMDLVHWFETKAVPVLKDIWDVIQKKVIPAFESVAKFIRDQLIPEVEKIWKKLADALIPVFKELWKQIETNIMPALKKLWKIFTDDLWPGIKVVVDIFTTLVAFIVKHLAPELLKLVGGAIQRSVDAIGWIVDAVKTLVDWGKRIGGVFQDAFGYIKSAYDHSGIGAIISGIGKVAGLAGKVGGAIGGVLGFADGGTTPYSGTFMVGERGPELITLPGGSHVTPNHELGGRGAGPTTVHIHASGPTLQDIVRVRIEKNTRSTRNAVRAGASRAFV